MKIWRSYKDTKETRVKVFRYGEKLHGLIMEAIRYHEDITHIKEMYEGLTELEREIDELRRSRKAEKQEAQAADVRVTI